MKISDTFSECHSCFSSCSFSQSCPVLSADSVSGASKRKRTSAVPLGTQQAPSHPPWCQQTAGRAAEAGLLPLVQLLLSEGANVEGGSLCGHSCWCFGAVNGCEFWRWARLLGRPVCKTWLHTTDSGPAPSHVIDFSSPEKWNSRDFPSFSSILYHFTPPFSPIFPPFCNHSARSCEI